MRTERRPLFGFLFRLLWRISVVWAVVSGFAHLPVIYRYAEAALPWLRPAAYSGTVAHYWAAAAMLCLTSYAAIVWLVRGTRSYSLTPFGMLRLVLLALLMLSGLGLILHNFQDFSFYGQYAPAVFFVLGTGTGIPLHSTSFDFEEDLLLSGFALYKALLTR